MALDFGCVLNDTEKRIIVTATNTSTVPVSYNWVFVEESVARPPVDPMSPMNATMSSALDVTNASASAELPDTVDDALLRADKVFDVLPIHGTIQPGAFCSFCLLSSRLFIHAACCYCLL